MSLKILTVDDSRTMRDMLRLALTQAGFEVVQAVETSDSTVAYTMALLYHGYAHLPVGVQEVSYSFLSRLKKAAFSDRPVPAA